MLTEQKKQKLFLDGVSQLDYNTKKSWYETCAECSGYFNKHQLLPNLLACGHVCCDQCLNQGQPCGCCGNQKVAKITKYKLLFPDENPNLFQKLSEALYDFHIIITTGFKSIDIRNQKPNTTFGQILTQFDDFVDYEKSLKSKVGVVVITKSYFYHDITDKPISDFLNILKPNKNRMSNTISIVDRKLGGF